MYLVSFKTKAGTHRGYVGLTSALNIRKAYHQLTPPAWMKCAAKSAELTYEILQEGIDGKLAGLAAEAWHAANMWKKSPAVIRGGAWPKPSLTDRMCSEIRRSAACKSPACLESLVASMPSGSLAKHLKDMSFNHTASNKAASRKKRSGKPGNQYRNEAVAKGCLDD